jgi:hypothetical protein
MFIKRIVNIAKDTVLQRIAAWVINKYHLKQLGQMSTLRLDSEKQEIFMVLNLHGEPTSIELAVHYRVLSSTLIEITDVRSSREWITTLVNNIVPAEAKRIPVPAAFTTALAKLIH